jgi:hypothetical protein
MEENPIYIIKNDHRNAFKTYDGWSTIDDGVLNGLQNVIRFTEGEMKANTDRLPSGSRFVYFPKRKWSDIK